MKKWRERLVLGLGAALVIIGSTWLWSGLDIVQIERGWSAVIGGATIVSAGFVISALAVVVERLRTIADILRETRAGSEAAGNGDPAQAPALRGRAHSSLDAPDNEGALQTLEGQRHVVGRHVSGESTYVMFSDGTVEAQTPDGTRTFASLDALRVYADEQGGDR